MFPFVVSTSESKQNHLAGATDLVVVVCLVVPRCCRRHFLCHGLDDGLIFTVYHNLVVLLQLLPFIYKPIRCVFRLLIDDLHGSQFI